MSGLDNIQINVEQNNPPLRTGNVRALLAELEAGLDALLQSGREHSIDVRSLPLLPGELAYLKETLGEGEVRADVNALGSSLVAETAVHGVWWVTHHNALDEVVAEFIEISFCPDIIRAHRDDIREALETLRARLAQE